MILPVYLYGSPILRKKAEEVTKDHPGLQQLIADMKETLKNADGVGLAAPQVGHPIRLLITDGAPFIKDDPDAGTFQRVMINPEILEYSSEVCHFNEGCLSVPNIHENVIRSSKIRIRYFDENFKECVEELSGISARITQHEFDHLEGILFSEKLSPIRRKLIGGKLNNISKGNAEAHYKTKIA